MINIEKNVPFPFKAKTGRKPKYPFEKMEIGDSFFVDNVLPRSLYQAAKVWSKRNNNKHNWRAYKEGDFGSRIWRIN